MIDPKDLQRRIHACWLGKNIGGTLGGPHEGKTGPLALSYYDPVPDRVLPNDDMDLQVVWIHHLLSERHATVTPDIMAVAWARHVNWPPDEYCIVRRNEAYGLKGAARGAFDNYFAESMGAAIRSEVWACIAPGDPARAAAFAWADAAVDHCGDGIYAEVFHAALQSAAFVDQDRDRLIAGALKFLPDDSRLKRGLKDTLEWWRQSGDWLKVRNQVVAAYATGNFTDVVCNLCFELIGWLAGEGDYGRSICIAVNCGFDTDCTGATLGALLGILDPDSIPAAWRKPIGEEVLLSKEIVGVPTPKDLTELTEWTLRLGTQLQHAPAVIGPVVPRRPADAATGLNWHLAFEEAAADRVDPFGSVPSASKWESKPCRGHWQRWRAADFGNAWKLLRLRFSVPAGQAVRLMAFYPPGVKAWVDGRRVIQFSESDMKADPFIAPSFHRARKAAHDFAPGELAAGVHDLVLACHRPRPNQVADFVVGLADPRTQFWLPNGLISLAP